MSGSIRVRIERLAPTGEGVAHSAGKVVFVDAALPGELVDAAVFEEKARHRRAAVIAVLEASPDRRELDAHTASCGGTDWAHFQPEPARRAKRELFRETMRRIGRLDPERFGDLPISASDLGYRLRSQFHVEKRGPESSAGFFARRSHRVVPLEGCEIVSADTRGKIARLGAEGALPEGRLEAVESVETGAPHELALRDERGRRVGDTPDAIDVRFDGHAFRVSAGSFFQVNRHRIGALFALVRQRSAACGARTALDAYAGAGFLSQALVEADARVTAVEASPSSAADALFNRSRFGAEDRLEPIAARVEDYVKGAPRMFDLVVADPPREGLKGTARSLAALARSRLLYLSCEPSSLARDLPVFLEGGFEIAFATLEDFFPLTHRVEAVVELVRS